jgi:hypothetical protein
MPILELTNIDVGMADALFIGLGLDEMREASRAPMGSQRQPVCGCSVSLHSSENADISRPSHN